MSSDIFQNENKTPDAMPTVAAPRGCIETHREVILPCKNLPKMHDAWNDDACTTQFSRVWVLGFLLCARACVLLGRLLAIKAFSFHNCASTRMIVTLSDILKALTQSSLGASEVRDQCPEGFVAKAWTR